MLCPTNHAEEMCLLFFVALRDHLSIGAVKEYRDRARNPEIFFCNKPTSHMNNGQLYKLALMFFEMQI